MKVRLSGKMRGSLQVLAGRPVSKARKGVGIGVLAFIVGVSEAQQLRCRSIDKVAWA